MWTQKLKLAFVFGCLFVCAGAWQPFATRGQQSAQQPTKPVATNQSAAQTSKDYGKFTHQSHLGTINVPGTNHARILKCDSCHERRDMMPELVPTTARNKQLALKFPGHKACFECHAPQFTANPPQTCSICHNSQAGQTAGLTARPPQRDFPRRYDFNAFFDARQHELHVKYALPNGQKTDCNFCHKQDAKPAVLTIASHPECYACHAPTSGDKLASQKSDCQVCHTQMAANVQPFAAKYTSRAYGARFTHKEHVSYVNNDCYACHTINGGYNQSSPGSLRIKQHVTPNQRGGRGCFSCHDGGTHYGRTVFSGEYDNPGGAACQRCHTREDFKVFPSSG
jgi:hypothetical protein